MLRWNIDLPMITHNCLKSLKMLVLFEFIPTESIVSWIKGKVGIENSRSDVKSIDSNKEFEVDLLKDGTIIIMGALALVVIGIILLMSKCDSLIYSDYRVYKTYMTIRRKIFYNSIIRYFYTGAMKLQMTACEIFIVGFTLTFATCSQWFMAIMIFLTTYGI